jgi:hypothetical protein
MPRFKVLKGVAHNVGHSFISPTNYSGDDYSMGHILTFARKTGIDTLTIDFITGQGQPASLLGEPISELPGWYTEMFWRLVQSSGSDRNLVQAATLTLTYDLQRSRPGPFANSRQNPYKCNVSVQDVRGRNYQAHFEGWWYVERRLRPFSGWWESLGRLWSRCLAKTGQ